jgi:uncharacterized membrane protein
MTNGVRFFSVGPLSLLAIIIIIGLAILIIPLFLLGLIGDAFTRLGFSWIEAIAVVLLMVFGSMINIPVYHVRRDIVRVAHDTVQGYGIEAGAAPIWETVVSVNLGGAVIPVCVAAYLLSKAIIVTGESLLVPVTAGVLLVSGISYFSTRAVAGVGIRVPLVIPGVTALLAGALLTGGTGVSAVMVAIVSGVTGILLGGNLARMSGIRDLEVPVVSIGGAGTFGAVFLCCILPALLAYTGIYG